ncbi:MAG: 5-(carboxyamino)imidazole ribonucleotide synthase [Halobacteriales archaeon]
MNGGTADDVAIGEDGPVLGIIGGGQLGRMLAEAAAPLGVEVVVADPTPDCPAAAVAREQVAGGFQDREAIAAVAERADVLTYEIELVDPDALASVAEAAGVAVQPSPEALRITGDKLAEKRHLEAAGVPVPAFRAVDEEADLEAAFDALGRPLMLKARRGGYDGRGNVPVGDVDEAADELGGLSGLIAEELVGFDRELSVIGVRGASEIATFPAGENRHEAEILRETVAPASGDAVVERADSVARSVLEVLDGRGVFGVELFEVDGEVLVNEIAPRPHNSGHYTIEGALTSQFAQHVRAVLGWPLGSTALRGPAVTANVLGNGSARPARLNGVGAVLRTPGASLHWYGKREVRPLRKMGHVTCVPAEDEERDELLASARELVEGLSFA